MATRGGNFSIDLVVVKDLDDFPTSRLGFVDNNGDFGGDEDLERVRGDDVDEIVTFLDEVLEECLTWRDKRVNFVNDDLEGEKDDFDDKTASLYDNLDESSTCRLSL